MIAPSPVPAIVRLGQIALFGASALLLAAHVFGPGLKSWGHIIITVDGTDVALLGLVVLAAVIPHLKTIPTPWGPAELAYARRDADQVKRKVESLVPADRRPIAAETAASAAINPLDALQDAKNSVREALQDLWRNRVPNEPPPDTIRGCAVGLAAKGIINTTAESAADKLDSLNVVDSAIAREAAYSAELLTVHLRSLWATASA